MLHLSATWLRLPQAYIPPPNDIPGINGLKPVKPKGGRKRWQGGDGTLYEWDSLHGTLEKYDRRGRHLGEYDHVTGAQRKPPDPARSIEP